MKTQTYKDKAAFLARENKDENGVSQEFADANPNWEAANSTNEGCWNCFDCSGCSRCSDCSDCSDCSGCSRCSDCSRCSRCSDCSDCSDCSRCYDKKYKKDNESNTATIPAIKNIHTKVLEAVSDQGTLDMTSWHSCGTTHCRGGWVITLAGEAGKKLESETSSEFAAMMIYKASSPIKVYPPRFYEPNEVALADIKRCAELEKAGAVQEKA